MKRFPEPTVLFRAALQGLGLDPEEATQRDIIRAMEKRFPDLQVEQSSVSRWRRGSGFRYETTLAMLDAAGWLNDRAVVAAQRDAARAVAREGAKKAGELGEVESHVQVVRRRESAS